VAKIVTVFPEDRNSYMHSFNAIFRYWPGKVSSYSGFERITVISSSVLGIFHFLGGFPYHNSSKTGSVLAFRWKREDCRDEYRPLSN
jgi:hypothetical protein